MDQTLKELIVDELCDALEKMVENKFSNLRAIEPTESVLSNMARAAVQVLEAYIIGREENNTEIGQ